MNQSDLRTNLYQDLSHIGSARNMFKLFQDSMEITRFFQHPDILEP